MEQEIDQISELRGETEKMQVVPYSEQVKKIALPGPSGQTVKMVSDMNKGFTDEELEILQNKQLHLPGDVFLESMKNPKYADEIFEKAGKINKDLGQKKGHLSVTRKSRNSNKDKIAEYDEQIDTLKKYRKRIGIIEERQQTLKIGKGIYPQPKRNAYKINPANGNYGNFIIDVPKLFGQLRLVAYQKSI